jgi:hypothetical protein
MRREEDSSRKEATMKLKATRLLIISVLLTLDPAWARADVLSSSNPALAGQPVTFTVQIEAPDGVTATPTGTVTFADGGQSIGTVMLQSGIASFTTQFTSVGDHEIVGSYSGDQNFQPATTPAFLEHITADDLFTMSVAPPMVSQRAGAGSGIDLTLFSNNSSPGPVHFTCEDLPPGATCAFDSNAVVPSPSGTGTKMTITSTGDSRASQSSLSMSLLAVLFVPLPFLGGRRSLMAACALVCLFLVACGGHLHLINGGTPPGSYTIHVLGNDGTDTQLASVKLNVT